MSLSDHQHALVKILECWRWGVCRRDISHHNNPPYLSLPRAVLPLIAKRAVRGGVVCVSSASADGCYFLSTYAGTKGFERSFALSMALESRKNMDVLALTPYFFSSNLFPKDKSHSIAPASSVAAGALRALGRCSQTMGARRHEVYLRIGCFL